MSADSTMPCAACDGYGQCALDDGRTVKCPECAGNGWVPVCPECEGTGDDPTWQGPDGADVLLCDHCDGTGADPERDMSTGY